MNVHRRQDSHLKLKRFIHPHCATCGADFEDRADWAYHQLGAEHLSNLAAGGGPDGVITVRCSTSTTTSTSTSTTTSIASTNSITIPSASFTTTITRELKQFAATLGGDKNQLFKSLKSGKSQERTADKDRDRAGGKDRKDRTSRFGGQTKVWQALTPHSSTITP